MTALLLQVAAVVTLARGQATIPISNADRTPVTVTVALHHATQVAGVVVLGAAVRGRVSPRAFSLRPGERQLVRVRVDEPLRPGEVLRLVTVFTPILEPPRAAPSAPVVRLTYATRYLTKVVAP